MNKITLRALAALTLASLAFSIAPLPLPEKAPMSKEALTRVATHIVVGTVLRVYSVDEKEPGYSYKRSIVEILVESVEKAPGGRSEVAGASTLDTSLEGQLVYARWFVRRDLRTPPAPGGSGHHGWTPKRGDRLRVYLARDAHDGFLTAEQNADGGYNVVVPNGFETLDARPKSR